MFTLVESIKAQIRREFGLGPWEVVFYRHDHGLHGCASCKRYYELLDSCPVRLPDNGSS